MSALIILAITKSATNTALGEVGSRLVTETFHGLIECSRFSILKEGGWKPSLPAINPNHYRLADLLHFVGDLNPLGDQP